MEFNVRQKKVINAEENKILCLAAASSGKTRVLTERVRVLIQEKGVSPTDIVAITFTNMAAEEMRKRLSLHIGDVASQIFIGTIHSYANKICIDNGINTNRYISNEQYDEIIKMAIKVPKTKLKKISHLLVDECQDLSELEFNFFQHLVYDNILFVGDNRQCQPAGTKVYLKDGIIKNIEDIKVGDSVIWYDNNKSYICGEKTTSQSIQKRVTKIAVREFVNEDLITIKTKNHETKYTPNHIGFVRINQCEYNHVVYLMCDDNYRFRIGKIPFTSTNKCHGNPWRDKMYKEGCTKIWILKAFKTDKDARVLETKLSYKYGIPQTCWQTDKVKWTKEDIDYIYEDLDTYSSAVECLKEFHRSIEYPLIDKETEKSNHIHFAKNAVTQIFAANIMPEIMEVLIYDKKEKHKKRYEKITEVTYDFIKTPISVYSLEVEGETYVADEIVTHNCIYSFRGCSSKYLEQMHSDATYTKYYLTENYRNAPNIMHYADDFLASMPQLSPASIAIKTKSGNISECSFYEALEELEWSQNWGSWFILTRTNKELDNIMEVLQQKEIPCVTFKKSDLTQAQLEQVMASNKVKVLTIHMSKGLENKNVIVVGAKTFNLDERKICYVAATRAQNNLYWCPTIVKRGKTHKTRTVFDASDSDIMEF